MIETGFFKCECRHCDGHIEYPAAAAGQTAPCPHCGKETELGTARKKSIPAPLVIGVAVLILMSGTALWYMVNGKNEPGAGNPPAATNAPVAKKPTDEIITNQFSVSGVKLDHITNSSLIYVTGKVRNLAAQKRYGVKVEFSLLTRNATSAGNASDYASSLDPNSDWHFKALVLDSKAATVKFNSIAETQ